MAYHHDMSTHVFILINNGLVHFSSFLNIKINNLQKILLYPSVFVLLKRVMFLFEVQDWITGSLDCYPALVLLVMHGCKKMVVT